MPQASSQLWTILYSVARWILPALAALSVLFILFWLLSDSRSRHESLRSLPGSGTVGELVVLSGSRDLDPNTWFPVPREGILGSVRSCDLVIPCPGVQPKHLDFSWEDGVGLLIHPRSGCEALVNGIPLTCRTKAASAPLTHGSLLQVGSAVLRLHLFAALDNTAAPAPQSPPDFVPPVPLPDQEPFQPEQPPFSQAPFSFPAEQNPFPSDPPFPPEQVFAAQPEPVQPPDSAPLPETFPQPEPEPRPEAVPRPRRSDRWKEDLGE